MAAKVSGIGLPKWINHVEDHHHRHCVPAQTGVEPEEEEPPEEGLHPEELQRVEELEPPEVPAPGSPRRRRGISLEGTQRRGPKITGTMTARKTT